MGSQVTSDKEAIADFLIARGGPFYELQRRLRLLREDAFRAGPRAAFFVFIAWGVPFLLSVIESNAFGEFGQFTCWRVNLH